MAKRIILSVLMMGLAISFCLAGDDVQRIPRVSYVDGDVSLQERGDTGWTTVDVNLPLQAGDRVVLEKEGLLEAEVDDGSFIRLNQFSELALHKLAEDEVILGFARGDLIIRVRSGVRYVIQTPLGDVVLDNEGLYRINVLPDETLELLVRDGKAKFLNRTLDVKVGEGRRLLVVNRGTETVAGLADRMDDFDNWSERRDARYASAGSSSYRYLPREVSVGVYDLDHYGRWVYLADYGYCWSPIVYASGWAPYRYGYWRYAPAWGWTWISYDPWGWLPYHYGRWWCHDSFGWVWMPGASWGVSWWSPACVRFSYWGGYVGWIPLGPGDYYGGYWNHGHRTYVQNNNYGTINNYYNLSNSRHHDAVTYVNENDFRNGRPIGHGVYSRNNVDRGSLRSAESVSFRGDQNVSRELFRRDNILEGAPKVDPIRSSNTTYVRSRGGVSGDASPSAGSYRSGTVTVGSAGRSRDTGSVSGRGSSSEGVPSANWSGTRSGSSDYSNRGRPDVSRGNTQDRSRSRQPEEATGTSTSGSRGTYQPPGTSSSRGSESRTVERDRSTTGRSGSTSGGSESRGSTRIESGSRSSSPSSSSSGSRSGASSTGTSSGSSTGSGTGRERRTPSPGDSFTQTWDSRTGGTDAGSATSYRQTDPVAGSRTSARTSTGSDSSYRATYSSRSEFAAPSRSSAPASGVSSPRSGSVSGGSFSSSRDSSSNARASVSNPGGGSRASSSGGFSSGGSRPSSSGTSGAARSSSSGGSSSRSSGSGRR